MTASILLAELGTFVAIFGGAVLLRRWLKLRPSPPAPPPTADEEVWLRELAALQLEARHKYC